MFFKSYYSSVDWMCTNFDDWRINIYQTKSPLCLTHLSVHVLHFLIIDKLTIQSTSGFKLRETLNHASRMLMLFLLRPTIKWRYHGVLMHALYFLLREIIYPFPLSLPFFFSSQLWHSHHRVQTLSLDKK